MDMDDRNFGVEVRKIENGWIVTKTFTDEKGEFKVIETFSASLPTIDVTEEN